MSRSRRMILTAALVAAACSDPVAPDIDRLEVTLSASSTSMRAGDAIDFEIAATNRTDRRLTFTTNSCVLVVRLVDAAGVERVHPWACDDIGLLHVLDPGDRLERTLEFDGRRRDSQLGEMVHFAPGSYEVVGAVSRSVRSRSKPLRITIVP